MRAIRDAVHALPDGDQILVGGNTAIQIDTVDTSARDLRVIIPVVLLAVLIVLILLLRSLIAALLLVVATVLSFGARWASRRWCSTTSSTSPAPTRPSRCSRSSSWSPSASTTRSS